MELGPEQALGLSQIISEVRLHGRRELVLEGEACKDALLEDARVSRARRDAAPGPEDARDRAVRFYRNYHSSRYVGDRFVIRLKRSLTESERDELESRFGRLAKDGRLETGGALSGEKFFLDLPRIYYRSKRRDFGVLRQLIDAINDLPGPDSTS